MPDTSEEWTIVDDQCMSPLLRPSSECLREGKHLVELDSILKESKVLQNPEIIERAARALSEMFSAARIISLERGLLETIGEVSTLKKEVESLRALVSQGQGPSRWNPRALDELVDMVQKIPMKYNTKEAFGKWQSQEHK